MTIADNMFLGVELSKANVFVDSKAMTEKAQQILDDFGLNSIKATDKVKTLSVAQKKVKIN